MKNILTWVFRLIILAFTLVLVLNNMQKVDLNLFNVYHINAPLILILFIFFIIGTVVGFIINMFRGFASRSSVKNIEAELNQLRKIIKHDSDKGN